MGKLTELRRGGDRGRAVRSEGAHLMVLSELGAVVTIEVSDGTHVSSVRLRPDDVDFLRGYLNDDL